MYYLVTTWMCPNHLKLNSEFLPVQQIIQALQESWSMLMASVEISGDLIHSDDTVVRTKKKIYINFICQSVIFWGDN